jgi:ribosomal protein S18 acetylase RimI-like enzyme
MLVAEEAGQIWGCGGMTGNRMGVYVHPSAHRRGIATALIQAMEKIALERGITELELSAPERAVAFYQSVGFTLIGPKTHAFKNGSELTTYDMVKTI